MKIEIFKEKMANGEVHFGYKIEAHGMKGHPPILENWFATQEGFKKQLIHYIEQYIGRENKTKKVK
jgi:hypothetical protein